MYKARNNLLPGNIQKLFFEREGGYNLRRKLNLKILSVRTALKTFYISICGVKLWNGMSVELKVCPSMSQFRKRYKDVIFMRHGDEEGH